MARLAGYRRPVICIVMSEYGGVWLANTKRTDVCLWLKLACELHAIAQQSPKLPKLFLAVLGSFGQLYACFSFTCRQRLASIPRHSRDQRKQSFRDTIERICEGGRMHRLQPPPSARARPRLTALGVALYLSQSLISHRFFKSVQILLFIFLLHTVSVGYCSIN